GCWRASSASSGRSPGSDHRAAEPRHAAAEPRHAAAGPWRGPRGGPGSGPRRGAGAPVPLVGLLGPGAQRTEGRATGLGLCELEGRTSPSAEVRTLLGSGALVPGPAGGRGEVLGELSPLEAGVPLTGDLQLERH